MLAIFVSKGWDNQNLKWSLSQKVWNKLVSPSWENLLTQGWDKVWNKLVSQIETDLTLGPIQASIGPKQDFLILPEWEKREWLFNVDDKTNAPTVTHKPDPESGFSAVFVFVLVSFAHGPRSYSVAMFSHTWGNSQRGLQPCPSPLLWTRSRTYFHHWRRRAGSFNTRGFLFFFGGTGKLKGTTP